MDPVPSLTPVAAVVEGSTPLATHTRHSHRLRRVRAPDRHDVTLHRADVAVRDGSGTRTAQYCTNESVHVLNMKSASALVLECMRTFVMQHPRRVSGLRFDPELYGVRLGREHATDERRPHAHAPTAMATVLHVQQVPARLA